ncbi:Trm112 family protein [Ferrovibrio sp.]|uniref:Trm112 family protein n=1 Tax=Ferrovibrio sp. TaxID=1917215 RepID=UPI00311D41D7
MSDTGPNTTAPKATVDPKLLELLVCPVTKERLTWDRERNELVSDKAGLAFPIRDGIPIMLVDEARQIDDTPDHVRPATGHPAG